jgi:hypothetical protein
LAWRNWSFLKQKNEAVAEVSEEDFLEALSGTKSDELGKKVREDVHFMTSQAMAFLIWVDPIHMGMLG